MKTKLNHYLRILLPEAQPELDDNVNLNGIKRGQTREDFDHLSLGTREQLAVLLRLAFADVLAERGVPSMVVLDDALVNSDDDRRERMKHILYQADQNYQILFLTCHGAQYRDIGGHVHKI